MDPGTSAYLPWWQYNDGIPFTQPPKTPSLFGPLAEQLRAEPMLPPGQTFRAKADPRGLRHYLLMQYPQQMNQTYWY